MPKNPAANVGPAAVPAHGSTGTFAGRDLVIWALTVFAVGRAVTLAWILGVGARRGLPMSQTVGYWDGSWYIQAAKGGWPSVLPDLPPEGAGQDTTAFFPGFPLLIRVVHLTGLDWPASGLVATLLAGFAASALIALLVRSFSSGRVALLVVALWSLQPESYVLSVVYSEALFTALAAGTLLALIRHRWVLAGMLAGAASATRSVALALTVVAVVAAAQAWRRTPRSGRWTVSGLRPWLAPALSGWGVAAYFVLLRARTGAWTAWFDVEKRGWHMKSDPGISVVKNSIRSLSKTVRLFIEPTGTLVPEGITPIVLIVAILLAVALWRARTVPLELRLYGVGILVLLFVTGNSYASLPRILVPAFPLLIPVAVWLNRRSVGWTVAVLVPSLAAACYLGVLWFDTIRLATHCCAP